MVRCRARAVPTGRPESPRDVFGYPPDVADEPGPLGHRPGHADLVDLLHGALTEPVLIGAADDVYDRRLHVLSQRQAGMAFAWPGVVNMQTPGWPVMRPQAFAMWTAPCS